MYSETCLNWNLDYMETCLYQEFNREYSTCTLKFVVLMVVYIGRMSWAAGHHAHYIYMVVPNIFEFSACKCVHDILWCLEFF